MDLLITALADLFLIDVFNFYKSNSQELNIFLHMSMVKVLKFFQFIKFGITQNSNQNMAMMPNVEQDLLAIDQDHQINLLFY